MFEQQTITQVVNDLKTDGKTGLSQEEVRKRQEQYGPNTFEEKKPKTLVQMFLSQLRDPMIYILFAATAISLILREFSDAVIIVAVILLNAVIGVVQESKAEKSLEALKQLSSPSAMVKRDGMITEVPASELVPGDIVILEAGRTIPADLRLLTSVNLKVEESALTGESVPVEKDAGKVFEGDTTLGDRLNMAYLSTSVTYGRGEGIVVKTGMNTEIGKIAKMINEAVEEMTPLQKRLADLGKLLGIVAVVLCAALFAIAILQSRDIPEMLLTAISLAVAAIPEGLPAVVTIVLALGVQRMVKVNTIVRKLPAVETLGSVSVVCSDKTGTLTQNKMTVTKVYVNGTVKDAAELVYEEDRDFVNGFVLCTDAAIQGENRLGDPTELALLDMGESLGLSKDKLEEELPRINEQPFDSDRKMMTTVHKTDDGVIAYTKGAMDRIMGRCISITEKGETRPITDQDIEEINRAAKEMASMALRVLALAIRVDSDSAQEENLTFAGLVGMIDPPRPEAKDAVQIFKGASVTTVMITGDHRDTALAIAKELGIAENEAQCITGDELSKLNQEQLNEMVPNLRVFARVSPENKVMIVNAFRSHGHIVSMTGDGVNDAPSLKAADIGVAMGITGTDVAKGAADMVLTDDNFATIEKAIEEGRNIYGNIKKTVLFLLSSNFGEIITMFAAICAGLASPLKAIHILWVNLITDSLPGLALGVDSGDPEIMKSAPRNPKESLFAGGGLSLTLFYGFVIACITLSAFLFTPIGELTAAGQPVTYSAVKALLDNHPEIYMQSQTYAFTTLAISQIFHAIGMRNVHRSIFRMNHLENKMMIAAFIIGFCLQIAVTEVHFLTEAFETVELSIREWLTLTGLATAPLWFHELFCFVGFVRKRSAKSA